MGRLSNYKANAPKVILTDIPGFDGGESITCRSEVPFSIAQFFLDHQETLRVDAGAQDLAITVETYVELTDAFCEAVVESWSFLDDDDQPLPVQGEVFRRLDMEDAIQVIGLYFEAALRPLADRQGSGGSSDALPSSTGSAPA